MGGGEKLFNLRQRLMRAPAGFGSGLWTRRENRFATDSPLEGRVTSEPVSEMGFSEAKELRPDSKTFLDDAGSVRGGYFGLVGRSLVCVPRLASAAMSF